VAISIPPTLVALRQWAAEQEDPLAAQDSVGLLLSDDVAHSGYWNSPTNSAMFASTGGDGVHFSFVDLGDGVGESSPIVMTVPMSSDPNWILGENLRDFLSLGIASGFFVLGSLSYGADWAGDLEGHTETDQSRLLADLADRLGLHPWANVDERLRRLDERYGDQLIVADLPDQPET